MAEASSPGEIEIWGDGRAVRSFVYVDDLVDAVFRLMHSELVEPAKIGCAAAGTVDGLAGLVIEASGKEIALMHVEGPVGVRSRNFSHARIESLGWRAEVSLKEGIARTYRWVAAQVGAAREPARA